MLAAKHMTHVTMEVRRLFKSPVWLAKSVFVQVLVFAIALSAAQSSLNTRPRSSSALHLCNVHAYFALKSQASLTNMV